jgi:hypothetical protein
LVNPAFEGPVKSVLGLSTTEFDNITSGKFGVHDHGDKTFSIVDNVNEGKLVRKLKI